MESGEIIRGTQGRAGINPTSNYSCRASQKKEEENARGGREIHMKVREQRGKVSKS